MRRGAAAALALLAGCAVPHDTGPRKGGKEGPSLRVPYYADRRDQWGPASLAGVLNFWGRPTEPEDIRREIHFPKQRGSTALDLRNAAVARGFEAEMSGGSLDALKRELDAGRPVIVFVNDGIPIWPDEHFMVVTGYDDWLGGVYAHWGPHPYAFIRYAKFQKTWEKTGRWLLLVSKPATRADAPVSEPAAVCPPPRRTSKKIDNSSKAKTLPLVENAPSCIPARVIK